MSVTRRAYGNVSPFRFVVGDGTNDNGITQAGAGVKVLGVSGRDTHIPPYPGLDDGYHATASEKECLVYTQGDRCQIELGGTVTPDSYLKSDSSGKGVTADTDKDAFGFRTEEGGVAGELVWGNVVIGYLAA